MWLALRQLRQHAQLTQEQLGGLLDLSPSQIDRYEASPEDATLSLLLRWCQVCGTTLEDAMRAAGGAQLSAGLDFGAPYGDLHRRLELLSEYTEIMAPASGPELERPFAYSVEGFERALQLWRRKPTVLIAGRFDSGKSRLANCLMGSSPLPASYQPQTKCLAFIRHISERPAWQEADVWIMRPGFDAGDWRDQEKCEAGVEQTGGYEILRRKPGESLGANPRTALVYVDSPLLRACTLVDTPGFSDEPEAAAPDFAQMRPDVLIYTAPVVGFMNTEDFLRLSELLRLLPAGAHAQGPDWIHRLFLVATHAHPDITDEELELAKEEGTRRLFRQFEGTLFAEKGVSQSLLRRHCFTFWHEREARSRELNVAITRMLAIELPILVANAVDLAIQETKAQAPAWFAERVAAWEGALRALDENRHDVECMEDRQQRFAGMAQRRRQQIQQLLGELRAESRRFVEESVAPVFTWPAIEKLSAIYDNKKEAEAGAGHLVLEQAIEAIQAQLATLNGRLHAAIEEYFAGTGKDFEDFGIETGSGLVRIPVDVRGLFGAGLASLGTLGALGLWASSLGNLGGYIIVAKAAGVLSAVGLSIGSASLVAMVAALGGPVVAGVALAAGVAAFVKGIFGEGWRRRLAKVLAKKFAAQNVAGKLQAAVAGYWDGCEREFQQGAGAVEDGFAQYARASQELLEQGESGGREAIEQTIAELDQLKSFFAQLPWRSPG